MTIKTLVIVLSIVPAGIVGAAQSAEPRIVLRLPAANDVLVGPSRLAADVLPESTTVESVVFYVDGREACRAGARPFTCEWDAGPRTVARSVRVVAQLAGGVRLTATTRTAAMEVADSTDVDAVLVSAHVTDGKGRFVRGLGLADFALREDGVPQGVTFFGTEDTPADVVLLLDSSGSMVDSLSALKTAALSFLGALRPQDSSVVASFNTTMSVMSARTDSTAARTAAIAGLRAGGGTALYDAVIRAAALTSEKGGRRAVAVFTDGDDGASVASLQNVRTALQGHDVVLYVIATGKAADDKIVREQLTGLAEETGGRGFFASRISDAVTHFSDIVEDLSHQYVIGYAPLTPLGDGRWRRISVTVKGRDLEVRSREGYFASPRTRR